MNRVYLAGPDVFRADAMDHANYLKLLCHDYGFIGMYPLDADIDTNDDLNIVSKRIYEANIGLINSCNLVIANLNNFRGPECDSGTAWEVGYAIAKGIPVYGYCDDPYTEYKTHVSDPGYPYTQVENFENRFNLMIACSIRGPYDSIESALISAKIDLKI